jgi:hypothetical protein
VLFYNNTVLSETSAGSSANTHWRNNLILGSNALPNVFSVNTNTNYTSSDYNGFTQGAFQWNSPPSGVTRIGAQEPKLDARRYATFEEYVKGTGQDQHSVLVDHGIFEKVPKLDAKDLLTVQHLYKAEDFDFRLKAGSAAVDRGVALPNVTDGFTDRAPDLGALELGRPLPTYGPRK